MNTQQLKDTAQALAASDKGLLAMDESNPTCNQRWRYGEAKTPMYGRRSKLYIIVPNVTRRRAGVNTMQQWEQRTDSTHCS